MVQEKTAIAIHACGFKNETKICRVAKSRLQQALWCAVEETPFIISGGFPYRKGSTLLANLMGEHLVKENAEMGFATGFTKKIPTIYYATECFDSSTDVQNIIKIAKEKNFSYLLVVSSYWHLRVLELLYDFWTKELDYQGRYDTSRSHGEFDQLYTGLNTKFLYLIYYCLARIAIKTNLFKPLDKILSSIFSKRKNGYPCSGCN